MHWPVQRIGKLTFIFFFIYVGRYYDNTSPMHMLTRFFFILKHNT